MNKNYTIVTEEDAEKFRCPYAIIMQDIDKSRLFCDGCSYMAWIAETSDCIPTGKGRCGIVTVNLNK